MGPSSDSASKSRLSPGKVAEVYKGKHYYNVWYKLTQFDTKCLYTSLESKCKTVFPVPDYDHMEFACKSIFQNDFPPPQYVPKPEEDEDSFQERVFCSMLQMRYLTWNTLLKVGWENKTNKTMIYRSNRAYVLAQQTSRISGPGNVGRMDFVMEESDDEGNLPPKRDPVFLRETKG